MVKEEVVNHVPDSASWDWMKSNIPLFSCPDPDIEQIYYFRWWTYRKHIKNAPAGYIVTEFLKPVKHATDCNALSCALGLHIAEGRWLETPDYIDQYIRFWLYSGEGGASRNTITNSATGPPRLPMTAGWPIAGRIIWCLCFPVCSPITKSGNPNAAPKAACSGSATYPTAWRIPSFVRSLLKTKG